MKTRLSTTVLGIAAAAATIGLAAPAAADPSFAPSPTPGAEDNPSSPAKSCANSSMPGEDTSGAAASCASSGGGQGATPEGPGYDNIDPRG